MVLKWSFKMGKLLGRGWEMVGNSCETGGKQLRNGHKMP